MVKVISITALATLLPYVSALFIPEYVTDAARKHFHESEYEAPMHTSATAETIENQYIVVFHPHADDDAIAQHHSFLETSFLDTQPLLSQAGSQQTFDWHNPLHDLFGTVKHTYNITNKLKGYSGTFSTAAIDLLRKDPNVAYIEQDQEVHVYEQEKNAPWGLARISHRDSLGFSTFNKYDYDARGGQGVTGMTYPLNQADFSVYC
jgi:cerevisin